MIWPKICDIIIKTKYNFIIRNSLGGIRIDVAVYIGYNKYTTDHRVADADEMKFT